MGEKKNFLGVLKHTLAGTGARSGQCNRCGECCTILNACPFVSFDASGLAVCAIYEVRPDSCKQYPRANNQLCPSCGYSFQSRKQKVKQS
ncbi:MAG: hypothetical protein C4541_07155 [Candidatus Auribacter fodinae]|uniref:YkgJ family cysteine cluster protein n=1 Tax=Candidatus Auribacter fodinae TaxID=2093366 RepID=A0A3A4R7Y1_9BACT|nr:MAG: hypothetical protein C4541_07155 [Candidatus Auribacter fodinae]